MNPAILMVHVAPDLKFTRITTSNENQLPLMLSALLESVSCQQSGGAEILCWDPGIAAGQGQCKGRPSSEGRPGYDDPVDDLPGVIPAYDTQGRRRCLRRPAGSGCCDFSGTVCKVREDTDDNEIATGFHNQTDLRDSFEDHITPHFSCLFFVALKQTLMTSHL